MREVQSNNKKIYIAIFGENKFENLQLLLSSWVKGFKIHIVTPEDRNISYITKTANRIPFVKRYVEEAIVKHELPMTDYKGLWYELSKETIDLTLKFFDKKLSNSDGIIAYYNKRFNTNKFEAYIKGQISIQIFTLLSNLRFINSSRLPSGHILLIKNPITEFIISYMERKYGIKYQVKWILPRWGPFSLFVYYGWLFIEVMKRGIVFNKGRKNYKLSMEAAWGFQHSTLRDDILIDNKRFKSKDILLLQLYKTTHTNRTRAFKEAKKRGFDTASIPELKINVDKNIFAFLLFYFLTPIKNFFRLFSRKELYLFYYVFLFHKRCFPVELLMNLYNIKCYVSLKDWGDIEETIILNKYGTKSVIFHWSDFTFYKAHTKAFVAHNICYTWGDIHHIHYLNTYFVDRKVNIGCIYKEAFNEVIGNKNDIMPRIPNLKKGRKIVTFFDTSFNKSFETSEDFFLEYLALIKEFCKEEKDINILLKRKAIESYESGLSRTSQNRYKDLWNALTSCDNFNCLNTPKWNIEETIAISDVCISMGMNSPSTIALICGREGLYFDNTGNVYHPFARKYKNKIVFDDRGLLFKQINNILNEKFSCRDVITEREIREYDAFPDDNALERLKDNLHALIA